jgi:cytidine deaminase
MLNDADWQALAAAARAASAHAYCPYSRFAVGAAVRTAEGRVFSGCNVENASFGLSICAERNAIFQAVAAGARDIVAVAVYTPTAEPVTPCGACRQVIAQFGNAQIACLNAHGETTRFALDELLPQRFRLEP